MSLIWCIWDNGRWSPMVQHSFTCSTQHFIKSRTDKPKLTCTFHLTESWNRPKDCKNSEESFCLYRPCIQREEKGKWIEFRVYFWLCLWMVFCLYIEIRGNHSVITGATLLNRHICSVGMDTTFPNRHICSRNRHIQSAEMSFLQIDTFDQNGQNCSK